MSQRPSSSNTAAVAGTLAGLLAAGLGVYYLYQQTPPAPPRPASAAAGGTPSAAASARAGGPATARSRQQAEALLMDLPEIKLWSERLEKKSAGKVHGALMQDSDEIATVEGEQYWRFSFMENGPQIAHRWESFYVPVRGERILIDDSANGELLSLERWRKEKQPLTRIGD